MDAGRGWKRNPDSLTYVSLMLFSEANSTSDVPTWWSYRGVAKKFRREATRSASVGVGTSQGRVTEY